MGCGLPGRRAVSLLVTVRMAHVAFNHEDPCYAAAVAPALCKFKLSLVVT